MVLVWVRIAWRQFPDWRQSAQNSRRGVLFSSNYAFLAAMIHFGKVAQSSVWSLKKKTFKVDRLPADGPWSIERYRITDPMPSHGKAASCHKRIGASLLFQIELA